MTRRSETTIHAFDLEPVAREHELAMARLDAAADSARAAGRPFVAHTLGHEAREIRAQRRRLRHAARLARDGVACPFDDPGIGGVDD